MSTLRLFSVFVSASAGCVLALAVGMVAAAPTDAMVQIEVSKLRNAHGNVGCLLFSSQDGYPEVHAKAYREVHASIDNDHAVCEFKDVAPGTYAAIVFHDENLNGKMDKNFMGVPQEGYAASNNVRHSFSAPGFQESSFVVSTGAAVSLNVQIGY